MNKLITYCCALIIISCWPCQIEGHGMMLNPAGRSSRWRVDGTAPINYNDNGLYCGGFWKQTQNNGLCGLCGDDYSEAQPRPNELGGKFGEGVIVQHYASDDLISVKVRITANHLGHFSFNLCDLDAWGSESERCFGQHWLTLEDGSPKYDIGSQTGDFNLKLQLPTGLSCEHCVLRWTYTAGNNWGWCDDGTGALGCGAQENFKNCADISITANKRSLLTALQPEEPVEIKAA